MNLIEKQEASLQLELYEFQTDPFLFKKILNDVSFWKHHQLKNIYFYEILK